MSDEPATYDPRVALQFFRSAGTLAEAPAGTLIFSDRPRRSGLLQRQSEAMYLLLKGEVELRARGRPIATAQPGEIFGELAAIAQAPRSAAAIAKTDCRLIALSERQFREALRRKPAFALMLMSLMIRRLRAMVASLEAAGELDADAAALEGAAFNPRHLAELARGLSDDPMVHFERRQTIVASGQAGLRMYVLMEGRALVKVGSRVVERLGPGGVFGEAALVDQSPRLASVVAETECSLLPITRKAFLGLVKMSPGFAEKMLGSLAERVRYTAARLYASGQVETPEEATAA